MNGVDLPFIRNFSPAQSNTLCTWQRHVSIMDGRYCLLALGSRPLHQHDAHPTRSQHSANNFVPPNASIDATAWQVQGRSLLFRLPFEILVIGVGMLPFSALGALALSCHACNQLAKWSQFHTAVVSNITQSGSDHSRLLSQLYREAILAYYREPPSHGKLAKLGPCIQTLVLRTNASSVALFSREDRNKEATDLYTEHLKTIAFVIRHALPNLRAIRFEDPVPMPSGIWHIVSQVGSLRELDLFNCYVNGTADSVFPTAMQTWGLKSLSIGDIGTRGMANSRIGGHELRDVPGEDSFVCRLLDLSCQTLKSLRLRCCSKSLTHQHRPFSLPGTESLHFPSLRELELDIFTSNIEFYRNILDPARNKQLEALSLAVNWNIPTMDAMFPSSDPQALHYPALRYLAALLNDNSTYLSSTGLMNGNTFATPCSLAVIAPVLEQNSQLETLQLELDARSLRLLLGSVVPLFGASFTRLTSLSLTLGWCRQDHSAVLFPLLSNIGTLQQLRVRVFGDVRPAAHWHIRHKDVRHSLSELKNLRRLAFEGDTYAATRFVTGNAYYTDKILEEQGAASYDEADDDDSASSHNYESIYTEPPAPESGFVPNAEPHLITSRLPDDRAARARARRGRSCVGSFPRRPLDLPQTNVDDAKWEREHRSRMLRHARNYFAAFEKLEWVFFGGVLMAPPRKPRGMGAMSKGKAAAECAQGPRVLGPFNPEARRLTEAGVRGFLDSTFGWKGFIPRELEEWSGVNVDCEDAICEQD